MREENKIIVDCKKFNQAKIAESSIKAYKNNIKSENEIYEIKIIVSLNKVKKVINTKLSKELKDQVKIYIKIKRIRSFRLIYNRNGLKKSR